MQRIKRFFNTLFTGLFRIDDTPQKISLGFGLGVFLGIFPGSGPVASVFLAMLLRVNRASALIGCLLTNTWISVVTLFLAIKIGFAIFGFDWNNIVQQIGVDIVKLRWLDLFRASSFKVFLPVFIGYITIGLILGIFAYLIALFALKKLR
ncbi:MAG: DUF2062 domain-containing protein [Candidatus Omnitrophica bacterium]|nr:DUF2062 domain-containing protein [Candidatus Omnitrophota bacterium]